MNTFNGTHSPECMCFSWKPVVAGALVAIGLSFLLNLFSVAIGLSSFNADTTGTQTLVFGGLVATALGIVASMFASGWVAGYLGHRYCTKRHLGSLYGFLAWCLALVITLFLFSNFQQYIKYYTLFISGAPSMNEVMHNNHPALTEPAANSVIVSTYILFVLFFLSAFASSLGGHVGMQHKCRED